MSLFPRLWRHAAIACLITATATTVALSGCAGLQANGGSGSTGSKGLATAAAQAMPVGDTPGWHQVFADDFRTNVSLGSFPTAVSAKWGGSYPDGWKDTSHHGVYMPSRVVSIRDGILNANVHTENGQHMVAALLPTIPGARGPVGGMLYGKYEVRIRADFAPGYKAAVLLWPDSSKWPEDGEIDFPEGNLDSSINGYVHLQGSRSASAQVQVATGQPYLTWHTATVTWLPTTLTFALDGKPVSTTTRRIPDTPMHMIIQIETATNGPPPAASSQGNVQLAWVTAYTPACNPSMSLVPSVAACMH